MSTQSIPRPPIVPQTAISDHGSGREWRRELIGQPVVSGESTVPASLPFLYVQ